MEDDMNSLDDLRETGLTTPGVQHRMSTLRSTYLIRLLVSSIMPGIVRSAVMKNSGGVSGKLARNTLSVKKSYS